MTSPQSPGQALTNDVHALVFAVDAVRERGSPDDCVQFVVCPDETVTPVDEYVSLTAVASGAIDLTAPVATLLPRVRTVEATLTRLSSEGMINDQLLTMCQAVLSRNIVRIRRVVAAGEQGVASSRICAYALTERVMEHLTELKRAVESREGSCLSA